MACCHAVPMNPDCFLMLAELLSVLFCALTLLPLVVLPTCVVLETLPSAVAKPCRT
jgi:hypothetical protein